jgi:uncharacterized protein (TIGR02996 family)
MTEGDALLQAAHDDPEDDTPRLVLADWLEDQGEAERADFIRVQVALARLAEGDEARPALQERERQLLPAVVGAWLAPLGAEVGTWRFERGLPHSVDLPVSAFLGHGEACLATGVRSIELYNTPRSLGDVVDVEALGACPHLARVRALDLRAHYLGAQEAVVLARSPYLVGLVELHLEGNAVQDEGAQALARCPYLGKLEVLGLGGNLVGDAGVRALAAEGLPALRVLDLGGNSLTDEGARALAASPLLGRLAVLDLSRNALSNAGVRALAGSPHLAGLRGLDLGYNFLGDAGLRALARCPGLAGLKALDLAGNHFGHAGVQAWRASPYIGRLLPPRYRDPR